MTLAETVRQAIDNERRSGLTQQSIAERHNVSRAYIQSLLTGRCPYEGITLDSLSRMFPSATLNLNGGSNHVITKLWANNGGVNVNNGVNYTSAEAFRQKAIAAIIRLNISGDALKLVLNALMNIEA